jgi:hypothetical protein
MAESAFMAEMLPSPLISQNQVELMQIDSASSPDMPGIGELGISAHSVEEILQDLLILLHQKFFRRRCLVIGAEQHGHRGSVLTSAAIKRRRIVAIEFGMWRSGRSGGTAGSITFG